MQNNMTFKPKEGFKILVSGTDFELESIYVRTRWSRSLDGKTLEVQGNVYLSRDKFSENESRVISVDIVKIDDDEQVSIPPIGNYGTHSIPENYDQNDFAYSHQIVTTVLSEYLEIDS